MLAGKKVLVVMPAYNAEQTLERTFQDIPFDVVDEVLLVDDASHDETVAVARKLGIRCFLHERNMGYGRNQKTCYTEALKLGRISWSWSTPIISIPPKLSRPWLAWWPAANTRWPSAPGF